MTTEPDAALIRWARNRRWLSATTLRRRLDMDRDEAERTIRALVLAGALYPEPEGAVYRVRYPQRLRAAA